MFSELSISRTSCSNQCPVYQATITSEGEVFWHGEKYVSYLGNKTYSLSAKKVKKIEDLLLSFDYKNFVYQSSPFMVSDSPSCIIRVVFKHGEVKTVVHDLGDRDHKKSDHKHSLFHLTRLERQIEKIAGLTPLIKQPLYLYYLKNNKGTTEEYVISSPSQEKAFELAGLKSVNSRDWEVVKLGKDATSALNPYIVLSKNKDKSSWFMKS